MSLIMAVMIVRVNISARVRVRGTGLASAPGIASVLERPIRSMALQWGFRVRGHSSA